MKYAIISDIHGNIHAFEAVLADARAQGVDIFLFIGDYTCSFPYGNDVANIMRKLQPAVAVRGNGEGYLIDLKGRDPKELLHEQFKPVYWGYRSLSPDNLDYMVNLPEMTVVKDGDTEINLAHSMGLFFRTPPVGLFHSHHICKIMKDEPFSHKEYLARAKKELLAYPGAVEEILSRPAGVYLFGHNHLQFHMEYAGRLFINPGACGEPLDWDTRAPYTILRVDATGWEVVERRVEYDLNLVANGLDLSGFTAYAPVWSEIMRLELFTGKDYFATFVKHVVDTARGLGEFDMPVSNKAWDVAVGTWDARVV